MDSNESIYKALFDINPAFAFNKSWMNRIMQKFLIAHFSGLKSIEDPDIHDKLWLANIKLIRENPEELSESDSNLNSLSANMTHLLLCFMHGIIYGPRVAESITTSKSQWRVIFLQNLMKYDMSECTKYFLKGFQEVFEYHLDIDYVRISEELLHVVQFLSSHPDDDSIINFYNQFINSNVYGFGYFEEVKCVIILKLHLKIVPESEVNYTFTELEYNGHSFSQSYFDRLSRDSLILAKLLSYKSYPRDVYLLKALYEKANVDEKDPMKYLWTRDHLNLFDLEMISILNGNPEEFVKLMIVAILAVSNPGLVHFDAFRKLISSGICNLQDLNSFQDECAYSCRKNLDQRNSILHYALVTTKCPTFFKIIMDESPFPINFFVLKTFEMPRVYKHIFDIFSNFSTEKLKIFVKSLKYDDPFPILFLSKYSSNELKSLLIGKKFNFQKMYKFDVDFKYFEIDKNCGSESNIGYCGTYAAIRNDRHILTFEEIFEIVRPNPGEFYKIFSQTFDESELKSRSSLKSCQKNSELNLDLSSPVSLSKFLHKGVLEPEQKKTKVGCIIC